MTANRFNFRAYIKPYNKIYKVHSIEMSGNFLAIECFQEDGETLLKRNDNETTIRTIALARHIAGCDDSRHDTGE